VVGIGPVLHPATVDQPPVPIDIGPLQTTFPDSGGITLATPQKQAQEARKPLKRLGERAVGEVGCAGFLRAPGQAQRWGAAGWALSGREPDQWRVSALLRGYPKCARWAGRGESKAATTVHKLSWIARRRCC
jgi:hypothetical protein